MLQTRLDLTTKKHSFEQKAQERLEQIHKERLELELDEKRIKNDLKRNTNRLKTEEDLVRTKAELQVCNEFLSDDDAISGQLPQADGKKELLHRFIDESYQHAGVRDEADEGLDIDTTHLPEHSSTRVNYSLKKNESSKSQVGSTRSSLVERELVEIVKTLVQNQRRSDLPSPEPGTFYGDNLQYPAWIRAFETLIENKTTEPKERIHYLRKYVSGEAKEAIDGLLLLNSDDAYQRAKELLKKRYGDPFAVANAYRQRLESWPKIQNGDAKALRKYADFLVHCETAMVGETSLHVLGDDLENRKMTAKLPKWLVNRWSREVYQHKEEHGKFPPFKKFVKFVSKESDIANDPVFSSQVSEVPSTKKPKDTGKPTKLVSSFSAVTKNDSLCNQESTTETKNDSNPDQSLCLLCKSPHDIDSCAKFLKKTVEERKYFAATNRLCFGCLKIGHRSKDCKERKSCDSCHRLHPTSLHGDLKVKTSNDVNSKEQRLDITKATSNNSKVKYSQATYSMIVPVWITHMNNPNDEKLIYALLDDQSDTTFVKENVLQDLGVKGEKTCLCLSTLHDENKMVDTNKVKGLVVQDLKRQVMIPLPKTFTRASIPAQRSQIPRPESAKLWPHTQHIAKQLMPYQNDIEVGLLIGLDCTRALIPREVITGDDNSPYALRTDLGWGMIGRYSDKSDDGEEDHIGVSHQIMSFEVSNPQASCYFTCQNKVKEIIDPLQINKMFELDFSESNTNKESLSFDEKRFLQKLNDGTTQRDDGHYQMPLPFREENPTMLNNRPLASHRLKKLQQRLTSNHEYYSFYTKAMNEVIEKGYAEKIPECQRVADVGKAWYIPHHGVFHPKKPDKLRVVYDCSAKYKGESLNDHLLSGPDLTNNLVGVLCRFRQEPYAFMGDIEGMFHQFKVDEKHRDFLRFLWWDKGNLQESPHEYRMTVHLFGATSSPGCANYGLKKIANDYEEEYGSDIADFIRNDFYVDDGLKSLSTEEEAISMIQKSQKMCAQGGLRLHKFISNSRKVIESIPPEDRAKDLKELDLQRTSLPLERALGVQWSIENDAFQFKIDVSSKPFTRRGILSTVSSIYDPLGFIAPVILSGKRILQELTRDNIDWDEPVPELLHQQWEKWVCTLPSLENLHIDRCYKPRDFGEVSTAELHNFSDASCHGYGQCSYLRLINSQHQVHCSFVMGKARVAPLRSITIPRLELTAALLSAKVSSVLKRELEFTQMKETLWTDSQVVLGYLNNDARRFHVFVANRVQQIRDQTNPEQWKYIKSSENPADIASRGLNANDLSSSSWLKGPSFLWKYEQPKRSEDNNLYTLSQEDPEVKQVQVHSTVASDVNMATILQRLEYFSDWHRSKKAIALCMKFIKKLKGITTSEPRPLLVKNLKEAEDIIIKLVQDDAFSKEKKILQALNADSDEISSAKKRSVTRKSSLYRLDPFIDERGIIRVGGRIRCSDYSYNVKHPIILPRKSHITELIVKFLHEKIKHQGRGMTLNELRNSGYWIIGGSSAIGRYIHDCVSCRRLRGKTEEQKMGDLPSDRLEPAPPFTYCAVDYFGPWYIKEGRKELKRYGVLFTCMACRAIHLETASSLDTSSFINALRRFLSRRGPIRQLRSDRGTNFVGAKRELQQAVEDLDSSKIHQFLLEKNCDWFKFEMNVPSSSHMGGSWERQIRTVRSVLSALLEDHGQQLDDESLRTLMCEAESIVNSRPLTVNNLCSPTAPEPLTPNHLLTGKTQVLLPPPTEFQQADLYSRRRWRRVQHLVNEFWLRWKKEFVLSLQQRQKWVRPRRSLQVNDVVMLKNEDSPRNQWPIARVQDCVLGRDGRVRKVKLVIGDATLDKKGKRTKIPTSLERPIHKVVLLVPQESS